MGDCGYEVFKLANIMRNTQAISRAAAPASVSEYINKTGAPSISFNFIWGDITTYNTKSLSAGESSTIPGSKPICIICRNSAKGSSRTQNSFLNLSLFLCFSLWNITKRHLRIIDYGVLTKGIIEYFKRINVDVSKLSEGKTKGKFVILLGSNISSIKIRDQLKKEKLENLAMFDAGVDMFDNRNFPKRYNSSEEEIEKQKEDVKDWSDRGGVLLTHSLQFRGCESTNVVVVLHSGAIVSVVFAHIFVFCTIGFSFFSFLYFNWLCPDFDKKIIGIIFLIGIAVACVSILLFFFLVGYFIDRFFPRGNRNYRSNLTRAVAGLGFVVSARDVKEHIMSKHYDVHVIE